MPRCPNCFYELVLLEKRRRYKCPKCSKLFPQREIEDKEFIVWNKKRRVEEKVKVGKELKELKKLQRKKKPKLTEEEKAKRIKEYYEKNRDKINQRFRKYYRENREHLLIKRKENYGKRKKDISAKQKEWREKNKILSRIRHLRNQQKKLALAQLEFGV